MVAQRERSTENVVSLFGGNRWSSMVVVDRAVCTTPSCSLLILPPSCVWLSRCKRNMSEREREREREREDNVSWADKVLLRGSLWLLCWCGDNCAFRHQEQRFQPRYSPLWQEFRQRTTSAFPRPPRLLSTCMFVARASLRVHILKIQESGFRLSYQVGSSFTRRLDGLGASWSLWELKVKTAMAQSCMYRFSSSLVQTRFCPILLTI